MVSVLPAKPWIEPVRGPFPDVARHVVQPVAVGREGVHGAGSVVAVGVGVLGREGALPDVHPVLAARLALVAPGEGLAIEPARGPRTPTRPRSAGACPPRCSTPGRRSRRHVRRGDRGDRRATTAGPPGAASRLPPPCATTEPRATAWVGGKSSGRSPAKTNDQPNRSASVAYPVASMKEAKASLETATASIQKESSEISRTGPSPSAG